MEVHHHPQLEHKPKPWKEYLLEGMMIFLAVFMGFIAENIRESISDHKRTSELAVSLYRDLKKDTIAAKKYIVKFNNIALNVDTLMRILAKKEIKDISTGELYWYAISASYYNAYIANTPTLNEIKSSGLLRYFSQPDVEAVLTKYNQQLQILSDLQEEQRGLYIEVRKAKAQLFYFQYNDEANALFASNDIKHKQARIDSFKNSHLPLLSSDKLALNNFVELTRSRFMKSNVILVDSIMNTEIKLMKALKTGYDINDE